MNESLQQVTETRLQQGLSPLQVQYARALEMTGLEFDDEVRRALDENPALEEDEDTTLMPRNDSGDDGATFDESPEEVQRADYRDEDDMPSYRVASSNRSADDPVYDPSGSQTAATTLLDYLRGQLELLDLDQEMRGLTGYVIGNLDRNGYLTRTVGQMVDDLAFGAGVIVSDERMGEAVELVRSLDPAGVGAGDLRQCLVLQLRRMAQDERTSDALRIVSDYFDLFANKHYDRLRSATQMSDSRLREAVDLIRSLDPKPGASFEAETGEDRFRRIVPDFEVETDGPRITVSMTGDQHRLRVAPSFVIDEHSQRGSRYPEEAAFVRRRRDEAADFIRAAEMRRDTLMRVMRAIVTLQHDFFMTGDPLSLRPMILKDVAALTGDDLSVISRATGGKYVQTATGIYPLKFFFNERPKEDLDASAHELLDALRNEIESEDTAHPLSDQALSERLTARGYDIARRTVTKYRERLGLPVARLRRKL